MRILLIGGRGFIGEYLLESLKSQPNCEVVVACLKAPRIKKDKNITFQEINLEKNKEGLTQLMKSAETAVVLTRPNKQIINNLILAGRASKSLKKIVYLSSLLVYPSVNRPQNENSRLAPLTDYEKDKYEEEKILAFFAKKKNIKFCIARIANVYGDIKNSGMINLISLALLKKQPLNINGDGSQTRDYIFVEDVANLLSFLVLFKQKKQQEVFNICTGLGSTIKEIVRAAEKIAKRKANLIFSQPILEKQTIVGNNKKILSLSGYKLKYDIGKGLRKTLNNYKKHLIK